jgi:hypothetical protein
MAASLPVIGMAEKAFGLPQPQADHNGISHTCESIHQEVAFKAARKRIYEALTDEKRFRQVTRFHHERRFDGDQSGSRRRIHDLRRRNHRTAR